MTRMQQQDKEIQEFRDLMPLPDRFEEGFGLKSVIGAIFVGMVMMPGSMYMTLVAGADLGPAARWVTVILFLEVARRSFTSMRRPELFVLYYMAGAAISSPFQGLLWNQFIVQSEPALSYGIAEAIPDWVAPGEEVLELRTFFHVGWFAPICLLVITQIVSRIDHFGLGYVLYRITSDVERLPFPMAPVGALGVTALAESEKGEGSWRWKLFSVGAMIGLFFGAIYVGVPSVTGVMFTNPVKILPIPWKDLTTVTEDILPAVPMGFSMDLTHLLLGMVMPFWAMVGEFGGLVITVIANPVLQKSGVLKSWETGMDTVKTQYFNTVDFYFSFGVGLALAIALIGFWQIFRAVRQVRREEKTHRKGGLRELLSSSKERGDIPVLASFGIYIFSTTSYILLCRYWLIPTFPVWILVVYGFVYTPLIAYVQARMEGMVGQHVEIPLVREGAFILSGYEGVGVWFAPIPLHNYAAQVREFRIVELTGTRLRSIIKAEFVIFPVVMIASIVFAQYIWRLAPIPSSVYPFTQQMWELQAFNQCIIYSSTLGRSSVFAEAFKPELIPVGTALGLGLYAFLARFGLPVMLVYGLVRGLGATLPHFVIPHFAGALLGRYYFQKKWGLKWRQYAPIILAGFTCGMGLISMLSLGIVFLAKSVNQSNF
jgi:hypothetical protein